MPNTLPPCQLVEILHHKAEARSDVQFAYLARLEDLRARVSGEVRFINQLFPEYTPHDEEYHLSRLFHVADTLIERDRYEGMNATELFVLACGLYAHDWGMAVSETERIYIVTGAPPPGTHASEFALLPNETTSFKQFLSDRGLNHSHVREKGIADEDWREYVRLTHAIRSAERIREYFANVDPGIAEASARVCEGHWLDFEKLQDYARYPSSFSVLRESLNLAALAVYVRLVDLLDIAIDRTPYVIWKFVAPRNSTSRMEWAKHRALQPVTCPPYLNGRLVLVDGSTADHEVFAALEDLRLYCEAQVRGCTDLLARLSDPRHQLDLYHVEWRVAARGFEPIPIRFEFERDRVFEILSDEIYQGDAHVFLRELLQNSIDAIRTRREFLRRRGVAPATFGMIRVEVEHGTDRSTRVQLTDDGIGMDAYIVRNYLAVAGRSFYRSDEFKRQGLPIDPISRFGIGILSCFMVADEVEIETYKDPYAPPPGDPLRIRIPSVTRQFRVEKQAPGAIEIGTRVIAHVSGKLLPSHVVKLEVTRYLQAVAGFAEFPIMVTEDGQHTLILSPYSQIDALSDPRFRDYIGDLDVYRIPLAFPIEDAVVPQDLETVRSEFIERSFDLVDDLGIASAEGRISFLELRDKSKWLEVYHTTSRRTVAVIDPSGQEGQVTVRWSGEWGGYMHESEEWSRSATPDPTFAIFRDGVLVAEANVVDRDENWVYTRAMPVPHWVINLRPTHAPELDVARTRLRPSSTHWYEQIINALEDKLAKDLHHELTSASKNERFTRFGLFLNTYQPFETFVRRPIRSEFPVVVLGAGGQFDVRTWASWGDAPVLVCPRILLSVVNRALVTFLRDQQAAHDLSGWQGEDALVLPVGGLIPTSIQAALYATERILEQEYHLGEVSLLRSPQEGLPPLVQEIWHPGSPESTLSLDELAEAAMNDPLGMSPRDRAAFLVESEHSYARHFAVIPEVAGNPFSAGSVINLAHPVSVLLFRSIGYLDREQRRKSKNPLKQKLKVGYLWDAALGLISATNLGKTISSNHVARFIEAAVEVGLPVGTASANDPAEIWPRGSSTYEDMKWTGITFGEPVSQ
jgi:hypothetical protein